MRRYGVTTIVSLAGSALAASILACAPAQVEPTTPRIDGRDWNLAVLRGQPVAPTADTSRHAMLRFDADSGRVYGSGGCNRISGPYTTSGDSLDFGAIISTRMACLDEQVSQREYEFLAVLDSTRRFGVNGDTLILFGDAGELARLLSAPDQ